MITNVLTETNNPGSSGCSAQQYVNSGDEPVRLEGKLVQNFFWYCKKILLWKCCNLWVWLQWLERRSQSANFQLVQVQQTCIAVRGCFDLKKCCCVQPSPWPFYCPCLLHAEHTQLTDTLKGLHSKHTLGAVLRAPPHPNPTLVEWVSTALRAVLVLCRPLEVRVLGPHSHQIMRVYAQLENVGSPKQTFDLIENTTETAHSDELVQAFLCRIPSKVMLHPDNTERNKRSFSVPFPLVKERKKEWGAVLTFNIKMFWLTPSSHV